MNETVQERRWETAAKWSIGLAAAGILVACGGGGGSSDGGTGTLKVALTDAPTCGYDNVYVTVEKVRVHTSDQAADADGGWREVVLAAPQRIDLLTLSNGVLAELGQTTLPAGRYSQVRLVLAANSGADPLANAVKPTGGTLVPLDTPSGQQSGLKLQAHFDVAANQTADLVLDFDACRSVVQRGNSGQYNLKPVVSVFQRLVTGIAGYVSPLMPLTSTRVAVQQGGITIRATAPDPVTGYFSLPYLANGAYDVVVTSEGRGTAVVTGVPVSITTGNTLINGTPTAILTATSSMRDVTGTVVVSSVVGTTTVYTPLADANVRALQALSGGPTVELANVAVEPTQGVYSVRLPIAAPAKASYSGTTTGVFTLDNTVAAKVVLQAQAPGRLPLDVAVDLNTVAPPVNFIFAP